MQQVLFCIQSAILSKRLHRAIAESGVNKLKYLVLKSIK